MLCLVFSCGGKDLFCLLAVRTCLSCDSVHKLCCHDGVHALWCYDGVHTLCLLSRWCSRTVVLRWCSHTVSVVTMVFTHCVVTMVFTHCVCCHDGVYALCGQVREERPQRPPGQPLHRPHPGLRNLSGRRQPCGAQGQWFDLVLSWK